jgi:pimeloyl-ACP methyl ester carboxylesterase
MDVEEIYDHQQDAQDVMRLLDRIVVRDDKTVVLGHSSGGCIAAYMAVLFPERISACFLYNSIPLHGMRFFPKLSAAGAPVKPFQTAESKQDFEDHCTAMEVLGLHSPDEAACRGIWDVIGAGGDPSRVDWLDPVGSTAMKRFHEACQKHRSRVGCNAGNAKFNLTPMETVNAAGTKLLQKLEAPMIALHGSKDPIVRAHIMKAIVDLAVSERWAPPGLLAYYEIPGAGHFAFLDKPDDFIHTYRQALSEHVLTKSRN